MVTYLLDVSIAWLLAAALYDGLLRRQATHAFNRVFLLVALVAGVCLPFIRWEVVDGANGSVLHNTIVDVAKAHSNISGVVSHSAHHLATWQVLLLGLYGVGALVALVRLLTEIRNLVIWHSAARRTPERNWIIVETGRDHGPFSLGRLLFVADRAVYSDQEWHMLLLHEGRHRQLLHVLDLALLSLFRLVFWFHPLTYWFHSRLVMVHEFQADEAANDMEAYKEFLVAQSLLQAAPSIVHSLHRSPLKERLLMSTRKISIVSRTRQLFVLPFIALYVLLTGTVHSQLPVRAKPGEKIARLAGQPGSTGMTVKQILADPYITVAEPGCEVTEFTISFLPKGQDLFGPYKTKGNALTDRQRQIIATHAGEKLKIFVEGVLVSCNGKEEHAVSCMVTTVPQ